MKMRLLNNKGFTLVELMVVVAIIGILSAIAIPNFKKYQAKSRTTEAKLQLAALYTAEISFATDYDVYATCLSNMGYDPTPNYKSRYYAVGFGLVGGSNATAITNGASCTDTGHGTDDKTAGSFGAFAAGRTSVGGVAITTTGFTRTTLGPNATTSADGGSFVASAVGVIAAGFTTVPTWAACTNCADAWQINQQKVLDQKHVGY